MNNEIDDPIDFLLRERFEGPLRADGFCERVMGQLPTRRRRNTWLLVVGVLAGAAMGGVSLWSAPITQVAWRDWFSGELSASAIVLLISMVGMAMLALAWTISETDDRCGSALGRIIR